MKLIGKNREPEEQEMFQVAPMVDVVFILLAFFVLTVRFEQGERDLPVGAAEVSQATGASSQDLPSEVIVRVRPGAGDGVWIAVGQTVLPEDGFDRLTATLEQMGAPELPVVLAADGALSVQQVARVMDAVLASPMKRLSLARLGGEGAAGSTQDAGGER